MSNTRILKITRCCDCPHHLRLSDDVWGLYGCMKNPTMRIKGMDMFKVQSWCRLPKEGKS